MDVHYIGGKGETGATRGRKGGGGRRLGVSNYYSCPATHVVFYYFYYCNHPDCSLGLIGKVGGIVCPSLGEGLLSNSKGGSALWIVKAPTTTTHDKTPSSTTKQGNHSSLTENLFLHDIIIKQQTSPWSKQIAPAKSAAKGGEAFIRKKAKKKDTELYIKISSPPFSFGKSTFC